jgi:hypothetical protein
VKRFVAAVLAVALSAGAARADDDVALLKKEIALLRELLLKEQDRSLDLKHEVDKQQEKIDALEKEKAKLQKDLFIAKAFVEALEKDLKSLEKDPVAWKKARDEAPDLEFKKQLARKVSLDFNDAPLEEVIAFLKDGDHFLNVVSAAKGKVSLKAKELSLSQVLDLIATNAEDVSWEARDRIIYILPKKSPPPVPPKVEVPEEQRAPLAKILTVHFEETPLEQVTSFVTEISGACLPKDISGVKLVPTQKVLAKNIKVSLVLREVPISTILDVLVRLHSLSWRVEDGKIVIDAP